MKTIISKNELFTKERTIAVLKTLAKGEGHVDWEAGRKPTALETKQAKGALDHALSIEIMRELLPRAIKIRARLAKAA